MVLQTIKVTMRVRQLNNGNIKHPKKTFSVRLRLKRIKVGLCYLKYKLVIVWY